MKRKTLSFLAAALLAVLLGVSLWRGESKKDVVETPSGNRPTKEKASRPSPPPLVPTAIGTIPQPRLFKSTRYPPETPEEKALWEWWRAMNKADPKFQWKMPLDFYGRIVDQFSEPVPGATVRITWTAVDDSHATEILSDSNGHFQFTGARGKGLDVSARKVGYLPTRNAGGGFEYASFSDDMFHVPDKGTPVVFRLQKLMGAEPMLKYITNAEVDVGPSPVLLNVETGKLGTDGDLSFSILTGAKGQYGPDFTITVTALNGAAFALSEEEFMFNAPEAGYQTVVVFNKLASAPNYNRVQPYRLYVKTRSGKYAAVTGEITIREGMSEGKAGFHAIIYHNPSGSRNLEFDHRKWLNR